MAERKTVSYSFYELQGLRVADLKTKIKDIGESVSGKKIVEKTRAAFNSGKTRDLKWRKKQLLALVNMMEKEEDALCDAMFKDLHKHKHEAKGMETNLVKNDAAHAYNHLDEWAGKQKVPRTLLTMSDSCYTQAEPYGLTLIIGAWNYPVQLTLLPLVGAIAAGNCAIIKPSEVSEHTAAVLAQLIPKYLDPECYPVINGGARETQDLLRERFDLIFYTGSTAVGKVVYEAAAKHLTPVVLELGGKSPVYVDESSDLDLAARRILWGRFTNAGQTCIAPDYIVCTKSVQDRLVERMRENMRLFYGDDPQKSDSFGRIVNKRHFERVKSYLEGAQVAIGGRTDDTDLYIEPTVLVNCRDSDAAMQNEMFGPVLPIQTVSGLEEAIRVINGRPKPLALYVFSRNQSHVDLFHNSTSSGALVVNDTFIHAGVDSLPFGGVGNSGIGAYHGKYSFDAFSHVKAVMVRPQGMEKVNDLRYPPYSERKTNLISWVMNKPVNSSWGLVRSTFSLLRLVVVGLVLGVVGKFFGVDKYLPGLRR